MHVIAAVIITMQLIFTAVLLAALAELKRDVSDVRKMIRQLGGTD